MSNKSEQPKWAVHVCKSCGRESEKKEYIWGREYPIPEGWSTERRESLGGVIPLDVFCPDCTRNRQ